MKLKLLLLPLLFSGCAYLTSTTKEHASILNTNIMVKVTRVRVYTLFDSQSQLTKFRNSNGGYHTNGYTAGTTIGALSETSSSTNLNSIINSVVAGAVEGAAKALTK